MGALKRGAAGQSSSRCVTYVLAESACRGTLSWAACAAPGECVLRSWWAMVKWLSSPRARWYWTVAVSPGELYARGFDGEPGRLRSALCRRLAGLENAVGRCKVTGTAMWIEICLGKVCQAITCRRTPRRVRYAPISAEPHPSWAGAPRKSPKLALWHVHVPLTTSCVGVYCMLGCRQCLRMSS